MSLRYFDNPYSELAAGEEIEMDYRLWRSRIKKIVESILRRENFTPSPTGMSLVLLYCVILLFNNIVSTFLEGGLYIGVAGVSYMLWHVASKFPEFKLKEKAR